jgi:hypothetical protein
MAIQVAVGVAAQPHPTPVATLTPPCDRLMHGVKMVGVNV